MREIHKKTATTTVALLKTKQIRWVCDKYHHSLELIETFFDCLPLFSMHHSDKWQVRSRCLFTFANDLLTLFLYDQILFCSRCQGKHMHRINCVSFWAHTIRSLHRRKQKKTLTICTHPGVIDVIVAFIPWRDTEACKLWIVKHCGNNKKSPKMGWQMNRGQAQRNEWMYPCMRSTLMHHVNRTSLLSCFSLFIHIRFWERENTQKCLVGKKRHAVLLDSQ